MRYLRPAGLHNETMQGTTGGYEIGLLGEADLVGQAFAGVGNNELPHLKALGRNFKSTHDKRLENGDVARLINDNSARRGPHGQAIGQPADKVQTLGQTNKSYVLTVVETLASVTAGNLPVVSSNHQINSPPVVKYHGKHMSTTP